MSIAKRRKLIVGVAASMAITVIDLVNGLADDSDGEDDSEEKLLIFGVYSETHPRKRIIPRCKNYFENVVPRYSFKEFQMNFRITPAAFKALCTKIIPVITKGWKTGHPYVNLEKKILAVIWLLSTPDCFRSVGNQFDLGKSSLSDAFVRVIFALNQIAPQVIKWPSHEKVNIIKEKFRSFGGLNHVIGAIDGTYIPIKAPKKDPEVYITRKCQYAFTLQCVAEPSLQFTDSFIGYPGSVGDRRLFSLSYLYRRVQSAVNNFFDEESYIIGDKAYPPKTWCVTPYLENRQLTAAEVSFNKIHSKTRQVIERSFALLFGRFRRLKYLDLNRTDYIPATVLASCVLHNICLAYDDLFINEYVAEGQPHVLNAEDLEDDQPEVARQAVNKRDRICLSLQERHNNNVN